MGYTPAANHSPMIIRLAASIFACEISHGMLGDSTAVETSLIEEINCRMSATSKGYYIQSLTSGKFMRSTVVVNPPELPPALPELPQPDGDDYSPSYMPDGEEEDHLYDDVEEPLEICPDGVVEKLHAPQGGAEVQVHVLNPKQLVVPTPGEIHLADGSRPRRLRGKQRLPPSVSKLLWTTTGEWAWSR